MKRPHFPIEMVGIPSLAEASKDDKMPALFLMKKVKIKMKGVFYKVIGDRGGLPE